MSLDTRYVPLFSLQEWFVDKNNGLPLEGGIVSFYDDNSRSVPKQVYELVSTNAPPSYTYVPIGSQLILSNVGTFIDGNGADIVPYLFPYDTSGNIDLYYITVQGSNGGPQFTREGVPNIASSSSAGTSPTLINHISNGQFQLHNFHAPVPGNVQLVYDGGATRGTVDVTSIAPGGIYFERTHNSTAVDTIIFNQNLAYTGGVNSASPRYNLEIQRSVGANDLVCGLTFRFMDVYKFSSPVATGTIPQLTFIFNANLKATGTLNGVAVNQVLYYGTSVSTGGSPGSATAVNPLATGLTITGSNLQYAVTFPYTPANTTTVGTDNNDFIEFEIAFPSNQTWDIQFNDVMLLNGTYTAGTITANTAVLFPQLTNGQFLLEALSNVAPTTHLSTEPYYPQDGSDLYLPMVKTVDGWAYDDSGIGSIVASMQISPGGNLLPCDGVGYLQSAYSALGVPYSRLFNKIFDSSSNQVPIFGTGPNFVTAFFNGGATSQLYLTTNEAGAQTAPAAGMISPGFTFSTALPGTASIGYRAFSNSGSVVEVIATISGATSGGNGFLPGTSGIVTYGSFSDPTQPVGFYSFRFTSVSAATLGNGSSTGKYFTFANTTGTYYMWFQTASEGDPTPMGFNTGIKVILDPTLSSVGTAFAISRAFMAAQINKIVMVSANTPIPAGASFTFQANATTYSPWYKVAGAGTAPSTANPIQINLAGTETAAQVVTLTQTAINSMFFAVPDLRGMFLRGADGTSIWNLDQSISGSLPQNQSSASPGVVQFDIFSSHNHGWKTNNTQSVNVGGTTPVAFGDPAMNALPQYIADVGGSENRPVNTTVYYFIRY